MFLLTTLFLDFLSLLSPSGGLFNTLLTLLLIGIKTIMYFSSMRVLEERGASWRWDPRAVMESARGVVPTQGGSGFAGEFQRLKEREGSGRVGARLGTSLVLATLVDVEETS